MIPPRPVRPRHAASLVLTRQRSGVTQILMGRRPARAVFPAAYVFPGGRLDKSDETISPSAPLTERTLNELCARGGCTPRLAQGLATTAIRETFEETGLLLASPGQTGSSESAWTEFAKQGIAPAHDRLRFLGRAITPAAAPVRFHARFFLADGDSLTGDLKSNGELLDLDWYALAATLSLPVIDVTKFILTELVQAEQGITRATPFFRYRRNKPLQSAKHEPR